MTESEHRPLMTAAFALTLIAGGLLTAALVHSDEPGKGGLALKVDVTKLEGRGNCTGCHDGDRDRDTKAWEASKHAKAMSLLNRSRKARKIRRKLKLRRADRDSVCVTCHGQPAREGASVRLVDGVTCEMCHGPAKGWIASHEHKARQADALAAGWIPPRSTYRLARNCLGCHVVDDARLVDVGGHPTPRPFELVAWSQGEVRHNFNKETGHSANEQSDPAQLRLFFVVGCLTDLELSLRALSRAGTDGTHAKALVARVERLRATLARIHGAVPALALGRQLDAALKGVTVAPGQPGPLATAAAAVERLARSVSDTVDGTTLTGVDRLLPAADQYMGKVYK